MVSLCLFLVFLRRLLKLALGLCEGAMFLVILVQPPNVALCQLQDTVVAQSKLLDHSFCPLVISVERYRQPRLLLNDKFHRSIELIECHVYFVGYAKGKTLYPVAPAARLP